MDFKCNIFYKFCSNSNLYMQFFQEFFNVNSSTPFGLMMVLLFPLMKHMNY
jgi:hypothetical protein